MLQLNKHVSQSLSKHATAYSSCEVAEIDVVEGYFEVRDFVSRVAGLQYFVHSALRRASMTHLDIIWHSVSICVESEQVHSRVSHIADFP